jgi:hypothetical protein
VPPARWRTTHLWRLRHERAGLAAPFVADCGGAIRLCRGAGTIGNQVTVSTEHPLLITAAVVDETPPVVPLLDLADARHPHAWACSEQGR